MYSEILYFSQPVDFSKVKYVSCECYLYGTGCLYANSTSNLDMYIELYNTNNVMIAQTYTCPSATGLNYSPGAIERMSGFPGYSIWLNETATSNTSELHSLTAFSSINWPTSGILSYAKIYAANSNSYQYNVGPCIITLKAWY